MPSPEFVAGYKAALEDAANAVRSTQYPTMACGVECEAVLLDEAIDAIRTLPVPASEAVKPVAYLIHHDAFPDKLAFDPLTEADKKYGYRLTPLYTSPPAPAVPDEQWRDEELEEVCRALHTPKPDYDAIRRRTMATHRATIKRLAEDD